MAGYVVKSWEINAKPNRNGNFVEIIGRAPGLLSWLLALAKIDPTISIFIKPNKVVYEEGSFQGKIRRIIPLGNVSSFFYGYTKPWKECLFWGLILAAFTFGISVIAALVFYFLNKTLSIGISERSGLLSGIDIKRSVIEGQKIDEEDAEKVCFILEQLVDLNGRSEAITEIKGLTPKRTKLEESPLLEANA